MGVAAHLLVDTIGVASVSTRSNYNDITFAAARDVLARVQQSTRLVPGPDGTQRESTHTIYTETAIALTDRIWLAGVSRIESTSLRPLAIEYSTFPDGRTGLYKVAV